MQIKYRVKRYVNNKFTGNSLQSEEAFSQITSQQYSHDHNFTAFQTDIFQL